MARPDTNPQLRPLDPPMPTSFVRSIILPLVGVALMAGAAYEVLVLENQTEEARQAQIIQTECRGAMRFSNIVDELHRRAQIATNEDDQTVIDDFNKWACNPKRLLYDVDSNTRIKTKEGTTLAGDMFHRLQIANYDGKPSWNVDDATAAFNNAGPRS